MPSKAILINQLPQRSDSFNNYDDKQSGIGGKLRYWQEGTPFNAHPLTMPEIIALSKLFQSALK